jgi:nucleoside-diphosphate-sugar epimerase
MKVLLCGHRAFAAQGLTYLLERRGHDVDHFSRGLPRPADGSIGGPVLDLDVNPGLSARYDAVINFIVLRGESVAANIAYFEALLRMCRRHEAKHLIQISSMSVYRDWVRCVTEQAPTKPCPSPSGGYAASKLAAELYLRRHADGIKVSIVRPACIVGQGMPDPLGSVGMLLPTREVLVLGPGLRRRPVIARSVLHQLVARLVSDPPHHGLETLLAVDRNSPTFLEYLQACCDVFKVGARAVCRPTPLWFGAFLRRELRNGWSGASLERSVSNLAQRCLMQEYDPSWSEGRAGVGFTVDWRRELSGN